MAYIFHHTISITYKRHTFGVDRDWDSCVHNIPFLVFNPEKDCENKASITIASIHIFLLYTDITYDSEIGKVIRVTEILELS